ncbi:ABC transporter, ATP-binding/permease protein [Pseudovibrio sp. FO-BEG1]|uniref:ATP-binding cassette, subfamily B n=1 Tax=Pseudovibrio denitrificans TaxID=258256 RepID=A0A1I6Y231_9HYPH|nr:MULTISPECIES: ABC transporter ATP-binding protein/permease [Pseudovibrio]AEV37176.1 ABC transporter, ATP-binding/permease protein [Pseudovibrio sp. FO-BEG1]EEA92683.1 ABC transporter, nucleotide binding/ATPase protein [Pseudovibrio sp. JE062]SFT44620.1 ATP-binding cassette, subfamily B [Pseudovibrio denitrificans]
MTATSKKQQEKSAPALDADDKGLLRSLKTLWVYMWPDARPELKKRVVLALAALIVAKIITVFAPYLYAWATDALTDNSVLPNWLPPILIAPIMLVIAYNVARTMAVGFNQIRDAIFSSVGLHAVRELANLTFQHLHALSLRYHLSRRTGGLTRVIDRGVKGIEGIVRFTILSGIPTVVEFAMMAVVIWFQFGFWYVVVVGVTVFAYVYYTVVASDKRIQIRRDMNNADNDANSKSVDSLLNFETVKYFGNEEMERGRFDKAMRGYERAAIKTWTSLSWLNFGQALILGVGMTTCMVMSAMAIQRGEQTIGDFVMINALLMQLSVPLNFIGFIYREIRQGIADLEAMFSVLAVEPEIQDEPLAENLKVKEATIKFEDVHFHYDEERPILKGVNFEVPAGSTIAIVGPSGAGKSTISRLLFRFYDVTSGRITIDGKDVREVTQKSLRDHIGMVPQDTVLFNDNIAYNIRYGRVNATDEEVKEAAKLAQIDHFIEALPHGYDSEVGERGLKLSGGEKQRVAIARTILKSPPILILDEATSALDTHTEQEIQSALDVVSKDRTTLVIAHRLSTVVNADQILVLKAGEAVEQGTHAELMANDGLYASMWSRQREVSEAEARLAEMREDDQGFISRGKSAEEAVIEGINDKK